ncbi:MAG: four helix bundle protein [Ferruginibacter sp.]
MDKKTLQNRTKQFHVDVLKFCGDFPKNAAGFETAKQIIRSAGSVGANYRASARAKSKADFINKIQIIIEEADESQYWLEVISESEIKKGEETNRLIKEANELTAIFTATNKTAKANNLQGKKS